MGGVDVSLERGAMVEDLGQHWKALCEATVLRAVTHGDRMREIMTRLLGGEVRAFDFLWLRATHPGRASAFHFDHVYMNRGTEDLYTVWTPLGDVAFEEGPILLLEGSHKWDDLIAEYRGLDVDKDASRPGHVTLNAVELAEKRNARLLSAAFHPGDILIFPMFMLHGSLDNRTPVGRVRLTCDARYQLASEPIDERWIGEDPIGHGKGYASMSGAQPATENPIYR